MPSFEETLANLRTRRDVVASALRYTTAEYGDETRADYAAQLEYSEEQIDEAVRAHARNLGMLEGTV